MELINKRFAVLVEDMFNDLEFWYPYSGIGLRASPAFVY